VIYSLFYEGAINKSQKLVIYFSLAHNGTVFLHKQQSKLIAIQWYATSKETLSCELIETTYTNKKRKIKQRRVVLSLAFVLLTKIQVIKRGLTSKQKILLLLSMRLLAKQMTNKRQFGRL
jgi:hypothetical protein